MEMLLSGGLIAIYKQVNAKFVRPTNCGVSSSERVGCGDGEGRGDHYRGREKFPSYPHAASQKPGKTQSHCREKLVKERAPQSQPLPSGYTVFQYSAGRGSGVVCAKQAFTEQLCVSLKVITMNGIHF